jgi:hypothetical protein
MKIESRLERAGLIVALGLAIQIGSLVPVHPLAFIVFVGVGVPIMAIGILMFLLSLVNQPEVNQD